MTQNLVAELQLLHRAAGRPSFRRISSEIRRHDHMPDTVSHETVSAILRGDGLPRWSKVECVVRYLAALAVHRPDQEEEVRRFHALWLAATDQARPAAAPANGVRPVSPAEPPPVAGPDVASPSPAITPMGLAPHRNKGFTGREELLELIETRLVGEPWQPLVLYGLGGVGKTQLAVEYFHRHADEYELVWWIAAEDRSRATASLVALGERKEWPASLDMAQTVTRVLSHLERGDLPWLIVFDNAGAPEELASLIPAAGGHVIVTTRDAAWLDAGRPVEVDVFSRRESIDLLQARGHGITFDEADQLAHRLGDLPLALEQVAAMQSATRTPVREYLRQLDERAVGLLAAAEPGQYQVTVATAFAVAADRVRGESLAAAHLLELLSCLGAEPISLSLLRRAAGHVAPLLSRLLDQPSLLDEAVRLLRRYGLIKVLDDGQALQVHRLVQAIVRDTLPPEARERAFDNAWRLLTAATSGGSPSDPLTWDMYAQIGPHLRPARVIEATDADSRQVVIDQAKYLYEIGDFEGSLRLSREALEVWIRRGDMDDQQAFACRHRLAAALYALGRHTESHRLAEEALERLETHPDYGPDHPLTLRIADLLAVRHRVVGRYDEALRLDRGRVERYRRIGGEEHRDTVSALNNLGASLRAVGDFQAAYDIDRKLTDTRRRWHGQEDQRTLLSISNLARDLYGLGKYAEALELQRSAWGAYQARLGRHVLVLSAWRTIVQCLRKTGQIAAALDEGSRLYRATQGRVGSDHELGLAATMTYANTLCVAGQVGRAWDMVTDAMARYRRHFGERNPLTLAAATNQAIILRALGERRRARQVSESSYYTLRQALGPKHPYTIAAAIGVGNDLVLAHEEENARSLLDQTLADARRVRGEHHPDTLTCAVNLGFLLSADSSNAELLSASLDELRRVLGPGHPLVVGATIGRLGECDIEPPPI